jgi:hypothetical protein
LHKGRSGVTARKASIGAGSIVHSRANAGFAAHRRRHQLVVFVQVHDFKRFFSAQRSSNLFKALIFRAFRAGGPGLPTKLSTENGDDRGPAAAAILPRPMGCDRHATACRRAERGRPPDGAHGMAPRP